MNEKSRKAFKSALLSTKGAIANKVIKKALEVATLLYSSVKVTKLLDFCLFLPFLAAWIFCLS